MTRIRLGAIGKTEIVLHAATPLFLLYALITGHFHLWMVATASILLHEGAHAAVAAGWGSPPQEIELTPLGAVMRLEDEGRLPAAKRLLMLLAGPTMTLLLCLLAITLTESGWLPCESGRMLFIGNLGILLMNLLPALPLDGGRVLALLLGTFLSQTAVKRSMRIIGSSLGISMVVLNVIVTWKYGGWNLSLAFAGCCLIYTASVATTSLAMAELRTFLDRKIRLEKRGTMQAATIYALHTTPLRKLLLRLPGNRLAQFVVLEIGTMRICGTMTEFEAVQQYLQCPQCTCLEAINRAKFAKK